MIGKDGLPVIGIIGGLENGMAIWNLGATSVQNFGMEFLKKKMPSRCEMVTIKAGSELIGLPLWNKSR